MREKQAPATLGWLPVMRSLMVGAEPHT